MGTIIASCILGIVAAVTAAAGWILSRRIPAEQQLRGRKRLLYLGLLPASWKQSVMRRFRLEDSEVRYYRAMYVNESPGAKRIEADCRFGIAAILLLVGLSTVLLISTFAGGFTATRLHEIERPDSGTGVTRLRAHYRNRQYDISMAVAEKQMTSEEILSEAAAAEDKMLGWILGDNESAERITSPLILPERLPGTPIAVSWSTSDYRIIDYAGGVHPELCGEDGEIVILTALLSYGDWEETMQIPVRVCRVAETVDPDRMRLEELLSACAEDQAYEPRIRLPEQWEGSGVEFYREERFSPWMFFFYAGLLGIVLSLLSASRRKQKRNERERQLLREYPELVSRMMLLLEAGSTIRLAWERVVSDYLRYRAKRGEQMYVYEEMLHTRNRMSSGIPEEVAYEEFGKACGNIRYLRFASVLVQNLKKGSASVLPLLRKEAAESFCDRREQAKQKGEEAGTKLLLPMAGILIVILAMVLVPAFFAL